MPLQKQAGTPLGGARLVDRAIARISCGKEGKNRVVVLVVLLVLLCELLLDTAASGRFSSCPRCHRQVRWVGRTPSASALVHVASIHRFISLSGNVWTVRLLVARQGGSDTNLAPPKAVPGMSSCFQSGMRMAPIDSEFV